MQRARMFFRSFSFRVGALIFIVFATTLTILRTLLFFETVDEANHTITALINERVTEIKIAIEEYGIDYTQKLVTDILQETHDKNFFLLLKHKEKIIGNIPYHDSLQEHKGYRNIHLKNQQNKLIHLKVKSISLKHGYNLLVGYDLKDFDKLKSSLFPVLMNNLLLAWFVSGLISIMIVMLLNRYLRRFNIACKKLVSGHFDYRIQSYGSKDEFDKLAHNINHMLDWNASLIQIVRDSSNAIAHDMRTPLSRLRLELNALAEQVESDENLQQAIFQNVERIDDLIIMFENILNISKAETRVNINLFETIDFKEIIGDIIEFYMPIIEEKNLKLTVTMPENAPLIRGDKQLLSQSVMNLIDNACKYLTEEQEINISLLEEKNKVSFIIADNGMGIPKELQDKAKERFFRVDKSRYTKGHGLGLSLVEAVATLHFGSLTLMDNNPGLKVIFSVKNIISSDKGK